ncbi:MAG: pyridoxamine 5'-phosphate oxidase family protein [Lachnospiraceae bacterium]|nr:pyridoxamine 5'-phosphate oxidase family protein [Lachnospiraceae bacterium]
MRKWLSLILAVMMSLSMAACGEAETIVETKSDEQLQQEGWVKNPGENGWITEEEALKRVSDALDAVSSPTVADAITGASTVVDEALQLSQEEIRALALDYLRGWPLKEDSEGNTIYSYREMYQIATSHNNKPGLSSVEFVIDTETMKLYASSEKGTEKCEHIKQNPYVVLYWYHQIPEEEYVAYSNDYFNSYGVQIKGTAKIMDPASDEAKKAAALYLETLYGAEAWAAQGENQSAVIEKLLQYNDWIEIDAEEYIVNSLMWSYNKEGSSRPQFYDPESPYYGKSVRQVYKVVD